MRKLFVTITVVVLLAVLAVSLVLFSGGTDLKLQWQEPGAGHRWAKLSIPNVGKDGFERIASNSGVTFENGLTDEQIMSNRHLLNGSGVALGDVDNDGRCDIYFCRLNGDNALYRNLGNWRFRDVTAEAGVACPDRFSTGALLADIDADGDLDLIVTALGGPNACFENDGTGKFTEVTQKAGLVSLRGRTGSTSMTMADVEGDGDLDLFLCNYKSKSTRDINPVFNSAGMVLARSDYGEPNTLYLNDGRGVFTAVKLSSDTFRDENGKTIPPPRDWTLTARFHDFDDDRNPDLYVCNDFLSPDRIWLNDGTGKFQAIPEFAVRNTSASTMAVDFSDIDRDGDFDFFLLDMLSREHKRRKMQMGAMIPTPVSIGKINDRPQLMRNTLFLSRGDGTYAEVAQYAGLHASDWSWSNIFMDVDLDGYEDVLISTGHAFDVQDADTENRIKSLKIRTVQDLRQTILMYPRLSTPNFIFRNRGDLTFEEVGSEWGFASEGISHGMATADLDNDGDLDVVLNNFQDKAGLYRNKNNRARIAVRLRGQSPNTEGIGAKIKLTSGSLIQIKEMTKGGHYLSSSEAMCMFAVPFDTEEMQLEVTWRNGSLSVVKAVEANRIYEIDEAFAVATPTSENSSHPPVFEDVSHMINHRHHETPFDDFSRQPLLPNRLSQLGPGITWLDYDRDGDDDLFIGSGRGGQLSCYRNDGESGFSLVQDPAITSEAPADQTTILGLAGKLLVGLSNFEDLQGKTASAAFFSCNDGAFNLQANLTPTVTSTGALASADYDGDGDLDVFVGGRSIPGQYPKAASSQLYLQEGGQLSPDQRNNPLLVDVGLVSGAVFSDIDNDNDSDLILAVEWGAPVLLKNNNGIFENVSADYGLDKYHGWWNGVTTGDLDEDGRLDIIMTNWGLNSKYHYLSDHPLQIKYGDFDNNGTLDIVEAHYDASLETVVPERGRSCMSNAMPFIAQRMATYEAYGAADLSGIFGTRLESAGELTANTLTHTAFFNRGNQFDAVQLPNEAQFAPAFYVGVADYDGDGHDDVFLSQNFFASQVETPRIDAGRGLWLRGDGSGYLAAVPGQESGIAVYGDQRGAALGDFNGDGRVDLAVSQNGAATKLYKNRGGKPGIRIRLIGPPENPDAIGAAVRLVYQNKPGPLREIHAGSGYWSQDSAVLVLGKSGEPEFIEVKWPGQGFVKYPFPENAREVAMTLSGEIHNRY